MPVRNGVGWSPDTTPGKQEAVGGLLGHLIGTMVLVQRKYPIWRPSIWVLDLTAGPGRYDSGMLGSPLLLAEHIRPAHAEGAPIHFVCCEKSPRTLTSLRMALDDAAPQLPVRYYTDQLEALSQVPSNALGLAYLDPNRWNELLPHLLGEINRRAPTVDVLFTRECGASLRMQGAPHTKHMPTIVDYIAALGKKKRYIARYSTRQNWALVFGSNWAERPQRMLRWPGGMLHDLEGDQGQALVRHFLLNRPDGPDGPDRPQQGGLPWAS